MDEHPHDAPQQEIKAEDIFTQRLNKVQELKAAGIDPFGKRFDNVTLTAEMRKNYDESAAEQPPVRVAGRMTAFRAMGKSIFADVKDSSGRLQLYVNRQEIGDEAFALFKKFDIGDIIGVDGVLFTTRTGELTLRASKITLLAKSHRPLPEKFHGLTDVEQRYRQRYLDLITNDESRAIFLKRSAIIHEVRKFLMDKGFIEVETPMLQAIPGGASANPFKTFYDALNSPMYMRIATELYLKKLLVGGFEKVFELNRNFRNEGVDRRHNPEFTAIEIYQAYSDCSGMMDLIEEMFTTIAMKVCGTLQIKHPNGTVIDLTRPWRRAPYAELIKEKAGADWYTLSHDEKFAKATAMGAPVTKEMNDLEITHEIYDKLIEETLIQPTFVTRLPAYLVPLAKRCEDDPSVVDVYELEINGQEISPGYSELNDPVDQRKRFVEQALAEGKDLEDAIDEDFLTAMEHGQPPAGGLGIGIDRMVMLLTGAESIRDVLLFPQMRIKGKGKAQDKEEAEVKADPAK
ncbi:MAG: lysine--tRNA ligase [Lentisphaeria bacterium]|nr:lysine--tRNA ligase [Lentisphaeria bacterium]